MLIFIHSSSDHRSGIRSEFVGKDHVNVGADILLDVLCQRAGLRIFSMEESEFPIALTNTDNNCFGTFSGQYAFAFVLSTYIGFRPLRRFHPCPACRHLFHSMADAMAEIPRRAIVDLEHPRKLVSRHPLARLANQIDRKEPFRKGKMCVMENRPSSNRKIVGMSHNQTGHASGSTRLSGSGISGTNAVTPAKELLKAIRHFLASSR